MTIGFVAMGNRRYFWRMGGPFVIMSCLTTDVRPRGSFIGKSDLYFVNRATSAFRWSGLRLSCPKSASEKLDFALSTAWTGWSFSTT